MWKLKGSSWFEYVGEYGRMCANNTDEECYKTVYSYIGLTDSEIANVTSCFYDSFTGKDLNVADNDLLRIEMGSYADSGVITWPAVIINHSPYKGSLTPGNLVAEAICDRFTHPPEMCSHLQEELIADTDDTHYFTIFIILLGMIIVLFVMLWFYKRMMRREVTKEMSIQISQMVS